MYECIYTLNFILRLESCGLDYVLDLVGEIELCPAFPALRNDTLRFGKRGGSRPVSPPRVPETPDLPSPSELSESSSLRRPQVIYFDIHSLEIVYLNIIYFKIRLFVYDSGASTGTSTQITTKLCRRFVRSIK